MRVVLDTNVLVSALVFPGGPPEAVYRMAIEKRFELVTSPPLLAELGRVLTEKFGRDLPAAREAVGGVSSVGTIVRPSRRLAVVDADPDDNRVLEAAVTGKADVIVSGDRHLRALGAWEGIRILDPSSFLEETTPK